MKKSMDAISVLVLSKLNQNLKENHTPHSDIINAMDIQQRHLFSELF